MNLKIKVCSIIFVALFAQQAFAANARSFTESCNATTGTIWQNKKIDSIYADLTDANNGLFITTRNNEIWRIGQAKYYPKDYQAAEVRALAKTAFLSGLPINICGTKSTNPVTVWIIELAR